MVRTIGKKEVEKAKAGAGGSKPSETRLQRERQQGRPGPDEQVPSRYAMRVGDIDVLVVSDGVLSLGHNADPAVRTAWLKDQFLPSDELPWALNEVVVRSGGRTILIDSGLGADPDLELTRAGRWGRRLKAAGIDLASVTDVVLTHLHMDHAGCFVPNELPHVTPTPSPLNNQTSGRTP